MFRATRPSKSVSSLADDGPRFNVAKTSTVSFVVLQWWTEDDSTFVRYAKQLHSLHWTALRALCCDPGCSSSNQDPIAARRVKPLRLVLGLG